MIYATVNLLIGERESICDKTITLYRGDRNVQVRFVLKDNKFTVLNQTYAQMIINRPSADSLFTECSPIENNTVILTITGDMINELTEIGIYQFQIRLYDENLESRVTLPPCNSSLIIEKPIILEEESVVNQARINDATVRYASEEIDIFDEEGNYNKTEWLDGDVISDARMNKIEDALYTINNKIGLSDDSDGFESDIESIKNDVDAVELECEQIKNDVDAVELECEQIKNDVQGLVDKNSEIQNEINIVEQECITLKNDNTQIKSDIETILAMIDEPPTYSKPTISVSLSNTNIEHSKSYDISITANFSKNDAGNVVGYKVYKNNTIIFENTSIAKYTDTISITHGTSVTYKAEVSYGDGPIKNTSLGIPYPSTSIKGGAVSATSTVKGYALSYYGVIDGSEFTSITGLTSELRTGKGDTITVSLTNQRVIYMYPRSFGNLTSIKDANNFDYINSYTLSTGTVNGVEYNIYILTDPVTITNFKQIYN